MMSRFLPEETRFLGAERFSADPATAKCVIVPVPYEKTSSYGTGSSCGPRAILDASHELELFDTHLGYEPHLECAGIATLCPVPCAQCDGATLSDRLQATVGELIQAGKFVATLGGEHTSIVGSVRAHAKQYDDLTVLQFDAHSDLRPEYLGDPWSHACAMARVLDVHPKLVQVGIRSQAKHERAISEERRLPVFYGERIQADDEAGLNWVDAIVNALSSRVYITLDCDVFDPALLPATGTPEPGGLTWRQMDRLLEAVCRERDVVGFDINELAPIDGLHHPQFVMAKLTYRLIGRAFHKGYS